MQYPDNVWFWIIWGFVSLCVFHQQVANFGMWIMKRFSSPFPSHYDEKCFMCNKDGSECSTCPYRHNPTTKEDKK